MKCPNCSNMENKLEDSRTNRDGNLTRRRRECLNCGERFTRGRVKELSARGQGERSQPRGLAPTRSPASLAGGLCVARRGAVKLLAGNEAASIAVAAPRSMGIQEATAPGTSYAAAH